MTIDSERLRAIDSTRHFLEIAYFDKKYKDQQKLIGMLLRHYPEEWWVKELEKTLKKKKG